MKKGNPWKKFYPQDWQGDEGLQLCSLAARGLWMEMLCIMWGNGGYLKIRDVQIDENHLARKTGTDLDQIRILIQELEDFDVFSRTRAGVIFSRRIVNDEKKAKTNRENGKNGGASKHRKNKGNSGLGNRKPTEPPTETPSPRSQKPETRVKEKNTKKENYWYAGVVIKLVKDDYEAWLVRYGGSDSQFMDWLKSRDIWYQDQPPEIQRRWFMSTANYLTKLEETA